MFFVMLLVLRQQDSRIVCCFLIILVFLLFSAVYVSMLLTFGKSGLWVACGRVVQCGIVAVFQCGTVVV